MFASIVHEKVLEIVRAGGQDHLVTFERGSVHRQCDITEGFQLRHCYYKSTFVFQGQDYLEQVIKHTEKV